MLGGVLAAAALLRLYGLGERSILWEDEIAVWQYALTGDELGVPAEAPLYSWLQLIWMWWIHAPTANTMQLLSVGLGVLDVAVAVWLGRLISGTKLGRVTAALMAVAPLGLVLSHEVRPYTLFIATSGCLLASYLVAWKRDNVRSWIVYGLALSAAAASHLLTGQICLALGVTSLAGFWIERKRPESRSRLLRFAAVSVVFGLVGFSWLLFRPSQAYLLTGPHADGPIDFLANVIASLGGASHTLLWPGTAVTLLALLGLWDLSRRRTLEAVLLGSVLLISGAVTWANLAPMSAANWHGWQRYLAHLLIPFLVLVAVGTQWLVERARLLGTRPTANAFAACLVLLPFALMAPGCARWFEQPIRHRMVDNMEVYATFACQHQDRVLGHLLVETAHDSERWLSMGAIRRRNAYHLVRHDRLATFGVGPTGVYGIENRAGRAGISLVPEQTPLRDPMVDGPYIVFPPTYGCDALLEAPVRGIVGSKTISAQRWGLICDVRFADS